MFPMIRPVVAAAACCLALPCGDAAPEDSPLPPVPPEPPVLLMKQAKDLIHKQEPWRTFPEVYLKGTPENMRIVVNLATQRATLMVGAEVSVDTPISSGKRGAPTPVGSFTVLEKIRNQQSSTYGSFVDKRGRTVRSGISMKLDVAPAGTHYVADPMPYFCRFTANGFGIHGGTLPGYPAAQGSIRVPEEVARFIYEKVHIGTPIEIRAE